MGSPDFTNRVTTVLASWLNPVNSAVYKANSAIAGVVAAMYRTALSKFTDVKHVKDWGAICDGVADDTAAVLAAVAALTDGDTLRYSGTPLISAKITIDKKIKLIGEGSPGGNSQFPSSYFLKKSTMTTAILEITAQGAQMINGGVRGETGNTGNGISILAPHVKCDGVFVFEMGNDGFSIGDPAASTNCNYWRLINCISLANVRDGIHIESQSSNANAGTAIDCVCDENGRDGIRNAKGNTNQFINCNGSGNDGWGLYLDDAEYPVVIGGDYEANTADGTHQIYIGSAAEFPSIIALREEFKILDESFTSASHPANIITKRLDKFVYLDMDWQPVLTGTTTAAKVVSSITRSGTTVTFNITGHGYAVGETFAVEDTGTLFDGGYLVASAPTVDSITAIVTADRASKLPASAGAANAYLGYDATVAGHWTRIGNMVFFEGYAAADGVALDATVTGNIRIRGFPFPAANEANHFSTPALLPNGVDFPAGTTVVQGFINPNAYYIDVFANGDDVASTPIPTGATGFKVTSAVTISGQYRATAYST